MWLDIVISKFHLMIFSDKICIGVLKEISSVYRGGSRDWK